MPTIRKYRYFHITVQPKNCDGSGREINFLTTELIELLDKHLCDTTQVLYYARAIERNKDLTGQHYHIVLFHHEKDKKSVQYYKDYINYLVGTIYNLSDNALQRLVFVKHKTKKQAYLCAGGYLTKQYKGRCLNTNISREELEKNRAEYETLVSNKKENEFSKWVLDCESRDYPHDLDRKNKYFEALSIIFKNDSEILAQFNSSNFHNFYLSILYKYKISFPFKCIKTFHRQILEYLYVKSKTNKIDNESLVNLLQFSKSDEFKIIEDENQFEQQTILNYWSLN